MQTSKSYLHAHIVRAGFDEKNYACGPIFGTVGKKHQLEIIIWKKWAKLSLRAHQLLFRTVWADDLFTVWGGFVL